jgi:hypothetical protein
MFLIRLIEYDYIFSKSMLNFEYMSKDINNLVKL